MSILIHAATGLMALAFTGPLDPSAAPIAPTGKTLTELEPRTSVQSLPAGVASLYLISQPGSYYLTGNITGVATKNGIQITADNVTLDLNGFALLGVSGAGDGLTGPSTSTYLKNVTISNGTIRGWPGSGINVPADNGTFADLRVSNNTLAGINTGTSLGTVITGCRVSDNAGGNIVTGASCIVERCTVMTTTLTGNAIGISTADASTVRDCTLASVRGTCILTGGQCVVERNVITNGKYDGINVGLKSTVRGNTVSGCTQTGIVLSGAQCTAQDNILTNCGPGSTSWGGIVTSQNNCLIEHNNASFCGQGIRATGNGGIIIRNVARQNLNNYTIGGSNAVGPLIVVTFVGDMTGTAGADHPWANFVY